MKKKIFGFDLGIASIGWAVVEFDNEYFDPETGEVVEGKIVKSGVRCFPVAENPKDGSSLAAPRREKRLARRICRRKARRMESIKRLFVAKNLVSDLRELNDLYASQKGGDVWNLRIKGLSEKLSKEELLRVLTHLAKHRGFKSYRKAVEENDAERGRVLKAINENKKLLSKDNTLAQVIVERAGKTGKKRNYTESDAKGMAKAIYNNSIPRNEIERELNLIYAEQKQYGIFSEDLFEDFKKIAFRYRPLGSVADMVGNCTFEKGEKRAPKEAPSSEFFVAWGKINNMAVYENAQKRFLSMEEKKALFELLKTTPKVKYQTIAKKIFVGKDIQFADVNYNLIRKKSKDGSSKEVNPEDAVFYEMKGWHKLKSLFEKDAWSEISKDISLLDRVVNVVVCEKNDENIIKGLKHINVPEKYIETFSSLTTDKFINLSLNALYKILPYMVQGMKYNEACEKAGYDFREKTDKLVEKKGVLLSVIPAEKQTKVPVVNRTISQFRKVYNAMVRQFGAPDQINIETGRELKKNYEERRKIINKNKENEQERKEAEEELRQENIKETSKNIWKYRLYQEQDGKCIYSGKSIDLRRLDEEDYLDVDHIIPYSRSLDDSFNNKVLCLSSENRMKGNKTPFEYIQNKDDWEAFEARVNLLRNNRKKENLLNKNFNDRELEFKERNANDNNYIAKYIKQYLEDGLDFSSSNRQDIKNRIQMRTGSLTSYLRHCWGLHKDRNENDRHHAQDAIVIACATQGMVKYLSTVSGLWENKWQVAQLKDNGEAWYKSLKYKFLEPWNGFREDVKQSLDEIFVSRPPRKSATGEIHQETIRSLNPKHKNYNKKDIKSGILVRGGLANNGSMLRTDVFVKKNKKGKDEFYLVPIYLSDMGKELPSKAIVPLKFEDEWLQIDDNFSFKFSLYMDDLVKVKKGEKEIFGYFKGTGRTTGSITIEAPDRSIITPSIGVKTQDAFKKYSVDPLGNYTEVKHESRIPLTLIKSNAQRYKEQQKG